MENPTNITVPREVHRELENLKGQGEAFYRVIGNLVRTAEKDSSSPTQNWASSASNRLRKGGDSVTITVPKGIRDSLEELKLHHREPLYEVILRLLVKAEEAGFRPEEEE